MNKTIKESCKILDYSVYSNEENIANSPIINNNNSLSVDNGHNDEIIENNYNSDHNFIKQQEEKVLEVSYIRILCFYIRKLYF